MISKRFIDQGVKIREDFLLVNKQLENILVEIKEVGLDLQKHTEELQNISDDMENYTDGDSAKLAILNKLTEVEIQGNRLASIYKPVNDKLEELKKQEEILYQTIKENYPDLTDDQIVGEFEPHIKKIN